MTKQNEKTYPGLVIEHHCIIDAASKDKAQNSFYGWKNVSLTPGQWIDRLEHGQTICMGVFTPKTDGKYSHKEEYWRSTQIIWTDGDHFKGVEFDDKGKDVNPNGIDPWAERNGLTKRFPELRNYAYAIGESVSSMSAEKPHRRYRIGFLFDKPITCGEHYRHILVKLSELFPVICPTERHPAQPVFGNAREVDNDFYPYGNVLKLSDFPMPTSPPPEATAQTQHTQNAKGYGTHNATQRKYQNNLDGLIRDANLTRHETGSDGTVRVDCPFNADHDKDAFVKLDEQGFPTFSCHHNSCNGKGFNAMAQLTGIEVLYTQNPTNQPSNINFAGEQPKWTEADIETEDSSPQLAEFPEELFFDVFETYREAHIDKVPMSDAFCFASIKHCISSTLGRKYYIDSEPEIFPNFYTALIGDSSDAAKGIALRQQAKMLRSIDPTVHTIKSLTTPAGLVNLFVQPNEKERQGADGETETYYIGGLADKITDTDFIVEMITNCCNKESFRISCQLGEFRDLLIKSARSTGAGLLELIMDIYDADDVIDSNTKVDASLAKYPTLSMIGGTDKRLIEKALGAEYIGGGLTNRFEWYLGHEIEERFINQRADSQLWGKAQNVLGNIRNKFDQSPQQVAFTIPSESETLGDDFLKKHKQHLKAIREDEELAADSLRRTKMHVLKNSLIFSVLCNKSDDTVIHPEQMQKAIILAKWTTNATQHIFNDFALGDDSNLKKRLIKLLTSNPRMSASQIGNRLRNENPTKLFQMLEVLTRHEVLIREIPKRTALYSVRKLSSE